MLLAAVAAIQTSTSTVVAQVQDGGVMYDGSSRTSFYLPVHDGTRLALNVYRPTSQGRLAEERLPVIFAFTPYRARYRNANGEVVEAINARDLGLSEMTRHGYVVAIADVRGKGASFGRRRGMQDRTEAMDGHFIVEWLATQPWSNGRVGMTGCSYLGGSALQVASTAPPHLRAVFSGASDFDKYDFVRRGGITGQFNTRPDEPLSVDLASMPVDDDPGGLLLRQAVAEHADNDPMAPLWNTMPYRDSMSRFTGTRYWEEVGPYSYLEALRGADIAYFLWGNWHDEPTSQILQAAANLDARVVIGPGSHCEAPPGIDLGDLQRHFFDHHLKGHATGIEEEPRFRWWTLNQDGDPWVTSNSYPGNGVTRTSLFASPGTSGTIASKNDGMLLPDAPTGGVDTFTVDYDVADGEYFPFWPAVLDEKGLTYTSPPLAADVTITGHPVAHLEVASDQPAGNLFVYLESVAPDGTAENVAFGRLALWNRALAAAPYDNLGLPWHSGLTADVLPVTPGNVYPVEIAMLPTSRLFPAGHRLRFSVRGADPRQRNIEEIRRDPPERLSVTLGAGSRVELPAGGPIRFDTGTGSGSGQDTLAPAGTGPHPAIFEEVAGLPDQVVYRPADLARLGEGTLALYVFGNGACSADGTSAKNHLLEIASHGYLAIAPGIIPGGGREMPRGAPASEGQLSADTPASALREAIEWAIAENGRAGSPFEGRIATDLIAVSGWSCGGLQALVTATDPRVRTSVIMYSGIFNDGGNPIAGIEVDKSLLDRIHGSALYVLGSPTDMAYPNGMDDFERLTGRAAAVVNIPVGHGGTFAEPDGGLGARVVVDWLQWQLRGDAAAAAQFSGADCGYCTDERLTIERKAID